MKDLKYELLAPAGDFSTLVSAIKAGADAVYFGLKEFSMRDNAKNFSIEDLEKINEECGKKVKKYLTMNVIVYDEEITKIKEILKKVKGKVDAIICWDLSVINLCRKLKIPFHISTQASVSNSESAKFYKDLGAERIVLARELNLEQIKEISSIIPVECFVHGAMCVAVSGRCFMSQELFKRSANRGMCTQVCRRSYKITDDEGRELKLNRNTVMSAKDLCTLPFIEKLKEAGIVSFKIEGRNRDARYVDTVIKAYRKAIDKNLTKPEIEEELKELKKVYNRGFSSGFYLGVPTNDDFSNVENSAATTRKQFIGKVTHYYPNASVGTILLSTGELHVGDEINIIGVTTGIEKIKVEKIEINKKPIEKAVKGEEVGVKLPKVRINDDVYIIKHF
ncbi:protease [Candidatus Pacearchaeota archaeon CG10_big_fil_rev_8_21_14_0_10_32_42]|nr:MAG: protease [Candidatus Pacearchaeota archaeon CG10_big_fil_rev_8_21_14_0_10_32_42]